MIGLRVRDLRKAGGRTQEALAAAAGLQAETVSRIETATVSADISSLAYLARALGVGIADIVDPERPLPSGGLESADIEILLAAKRLSPEAREALIRLMRAWPP